MTKDNIQAAIETNQPFTIRMADGKKYPVPHADFCFLPPTGNNVVLANENGGVWVLPLRTITGLYYQGAETSA